MELVDHLKNVGDTKVINKRVYYEKNGAIMLYPNRKIIELDDFWGIHYSDSIINVFTNRSFNLLYDYEGNLLSSYEKINFYYILSKDDFIYYDRVDKRTKRKDIKLYDGKIDLSYLKDNLFFFIDKELLRFCNIQDGSIYWQYDISSIANNPHNDVYNKAAEWKVKKFIGVIADKLWIALNHHTIIALDIKTGQLVHRIDCIDGFKCGWLPSAIPLPEATVIDEKNNVLIGFMWEFYWEINPIDGTLTFIDLTEELKLVAIRNDLAEFVLTEDSIYFASHPSESKIGLLDRKSKKVTWSYEFKTEEGEREVRIMQLQGNEEKIGALSSAKTLYIFEKE
ncbi:hypothetical protein [Myroides sp. N17-2]|uniref:hypothetical protein n=1 Tax=Myroides sp. N17-2 TaxID=2030799 RepID=UPI0020B12587|nr:hypothetical protein [Myroides sp. N17-2]